jgi:hypothetical protein
MEGQKTAVERSASYCIAAKEPKKNISELMDDFLDYARYELNFSPQTKPCFCVLQNIFMYSLCL